MKPVQLVLYLLALVLLVVAAFGVSVRRISFGWLGLAAWLLAELVPALDS